MRLKSASARISYSSVTRIPLLASLLLTIIHPTTVVAQDATQTITLSFLDAAGAPIGQPQIVPYAKCTALDTTQLVSTGGTYATIQTSDLRSAINIYEDQVCQQLNGASVGQWDNVAPVANMVSIRWEGTAPANYPTGGIRVDAFPKGMIIQTKLPTTPQWVMDPERGKLLVGIVSGVLAIGVIVGIYQVYQASLYEIPPKKKKKENGSNGLNIKKIKKKDAYYKKPAHTDHSTFQRLNSPAPSLAMGERQNYRDSHFSSSSVDWNQQKTMYNNGSDTVVVDMTESTMATVDEKIKIASGFLKAAPPDVRGLVGDDELLDGGILDALEDYNTEELATVDAIVSKHGQIEGNLFLHPKTNKAFKLDHFRQVASDPVDHTVDETIEDLRKAVEKETDAYVADRYAEGVSAVYGSNGIITIAIVHNKNGRWRSVWILDTASSEINGSMKCKVHYYEDGNVQLETSKEAEEKLSKSSSDPHADIAKAFLELIGSSESKYQTALNESYHDLAESTFNGLRRALPYTRTKLDWNKILTYRIGAELASNDGGDIWEDEDNISYDRAIAERDWTRMNDTFGNSGYREGIEEGKEGTLQQGFNQGWAEGVNYGYELGRLRGLISNALFTNVNDKEAWIKKASDLVKELIDLDIDKVFDKAFFDDGRSKKSSAAKSTGCCEGSSSKKESCCKNDTTTTTSSDCSSSTPASSTTDGCCSSKNGGSSTGCCSKRNNTTSGDGELLLSKPEQVMGSYQYRARELLKEAGLENILNPA
ncbi:F-actin-capping protein [Entomortierella beljakovae]|nr:F-actin-capping protein [Entomortierella beljakovae]